MSSKDEKDEKEEEYNERSGVHEEQFMEVNMCSYEAMTAKCKPWGESKSFAAINQGSFNVFLSQYFLITAQRVRRT